MFRSNRVSHPSKYAQHGFATRPRAGGRGNPPRIGRLQPPTTCSRCANTEIRPYAVRAVVQTRPEEFIVGSINSERLTQLPSA